MALFDREPCVIILLFLVLSVTSNQRVFDLTLLPLLQTRLAEISDHSTQVKNLVYLLADPKLFFQDITFDNGRKLCAELGLAELMHTTTFEQNKLYLAENLFTSDYIAQQLTYEHIKVRSLQNSTYSIFYGLLVQHVVGRDDLTGVMQGFIKEFFETLQREISENVRTEEGNKEHGPFLLSAIGHRFAKKVIQTVKSASEANKAFFEQHVEKFVRAIQNDLKSLMKTRGIFILIAILENSESGETLKMMLKKCKALEGVEKMAGVEIIANLLK